MSKQSKIVRVLETYRDRVRNSRDRVMARTLGNGTVQIFYNTTVVDLFCSETYVSVHGEQASLVLGLLMDARVVLPCVRSNYNARTILEAAAV